jgi:hypothetical protein
MAVLILVLVLVAVAVIAVVVWLVLRQRRSRALQSQFGPEYDRTVQAVGDRGHAEQELAARKQRVEEFALRPLSAVDQQRFAEAWRNTQARFVDDPRAATADADQLIGQVMAARGYPVGDFEARAADLSVDHPTVVSNYRAAHRVGQDAARSQVSTEDLRQALVHYRSLFDELLETPQATPVEEVGR